MPRALLGDLDFYYERAGSGPPLLFISGTGGDLRVKPSVMDGPLPKHFDTLAYDQRGLGQSAKPDHAYTMADYADDAARLMDFVAWEGAYVVGVSFGGMVAQEFVLRHPKRVRKLVLCCTSPGGAGGASFPFHEIDYMGREERARTMVPIADTRRDAAWVTAHKDQYEQFVALAAADPYADEPGHARGARLQLEARAKHDTWERLSGIRCPVMIAAGRYDGIAALDRQENMAKRISGAELQFFEGGHLFLIQDRAAFPKIVAFLNS